MNLRKIKGAKHFAKKFGQGCGDFDIVNNDGVDHFLVPVDLDYPHQTLLFWLQYKTTKVPRHFKLTAVHHHTSAEPNEKVKSVFTEFCDKYHITFKTKKVEETTDRSEYYKLLAQTAIENDCNKVAIPDSLDYLNALLLTNMSTSGIFSGAQVVQKIKSDDDSKEIILSRPFCYAGDDDIEKFSKEAGFECEPAGLKISEDPYMAVARTAMSDLISNYSNVKMNFFNSQFFINKKYMGIGEDKVLKSLDDVDFDEL